jgi:putative transposase
LEAKRGWVEPAHPQLSISRQCQLVGLARSSFYYQAAQEIPENLNLMRLLDEQYTRTPFYGSPRLTHWLRQRGYQVNHKRVERLMRRMGIQAVYPKPKLSQPGKEHRIYPYLLEGLCIEKPNQVWSTDITYVRLQQGFLYLVAILDWHSRYVVSWELSNSLDTSFCLSALERGLEQARPEIFNSDQGSQFTSQEFTGRLEAARIRISMDGRGRAFDNIFIERLWRTVKYEEVYLKSYQSVREAEFSLGLYFQFYNRERLHQALDYRTPHQVHFGS